MRARRFGARAADTGGPVRAPWRTGGRALSIHRLHRRQRLPIELAEAWRFFSDPRNLALITPPGLGLRVQSPLPERVYPGLIITYRIRLPFGVPGRWVTEISHLDEPHRFVDEQRLGPYRFWHHEHRFRALDGGTEIEDLVHYALPLWPLGELAHRPVVAPRLAEIFEYRRAVLERRFGRGDRPPGQSA